MGGRRSPDGVRVRTYRSGRRAIEIRFIYHGANCRETLRGLEPTPANITYARNLRGEILRAITLGTFDYGRYFPDSAAARRFGAAGSSATVGQLLDRWLADVQRTYRHSTATAYARAVRALQPALGAYRVVDLRPEHVREWLRGLDVTPKTCRNYLTPLRAICAQALQDGILAADPVAAVNTRLVVGRRPRVDHVDPLTTEEIRAVLAACQEHRPGWLQYWRFMLYTGCRPSEAFALRWGDVDLDAGTVRIERAVVERQAQDTTKTAAGTRTITLLPAALAALQGQRAATQLQGREVFLNPRTRRPIRDTDEPARCWAYLIKRSGVRYRNQYQCRHTYASQLLSGGENPWLVAQQMGHRDVSMVMRVYGRYVAQGDAQAPQWRAAYGQV